MGGVLLLQVTPSWWSEVNRCGAALTGSQYKPLTVSPYGAAAVNPLTAAQSQARYSLNQD